MFVKFLKINAILLLISSLSLAETINDITVSGNKRISKESIAIFGDISLNKNYNDDDLNIIFKNIYETNFFKDINLKINNSILEITVVENPIIEDVEINGIRSENLTELLFDKIQLKNRSSYIESFFLTIQIIFLDD